MEKNENEGYPRLIQSGNGPIFEGSGTNNFTCENCGNLLAINIHLRSLIAIDIQCGKCNHTTRTPSWPDNEAMPAILLTLGSEGHFRVDGPIILNEISAFSCYQEVARIISLTGSKPLPSHSLILSHESLENLVFELNFYTNNKFKKKLDSALRAYKSGNINFLESPLAWSIVHLRQRIQDRDNKLSNMDLVAIHYFYQYHEAIIAWKHHPMFPHIAKAISSEFHHLITMLATASYMEHLGNRIGFTETSTNTGRSPDLYINIGINNRLSIEVKAPKALHWPQNNQTLYDLERAITGALKSAGGQIIASSGLVVISASSFTANIKALFNEAIINVLALNRTSSKIEAVAGVVHTPYTDPRTYLQGSSESYFTIHNNPNFKGTKSIRQAR